MLKWLLQRQIDKFEKEYDYDASYARDIIKASTRAAFKLGRIMGFANFREDAPLEV